MRASILVCTCLLGSLACDPGREPPNNAGSTPQPPASPAPEAAPAQAPAQPAPEAAPRAPAQPQLAPLEAAALEPGVEPPSNAEVTRIARELGLENPAAAAKPVGVGPLTYVTAVRTRKGEPGRYALELMLLRLPDAQATAWTAAPRAHHRLHHWADEGWSDTPESIAVTLFAEDFDGDGRPEVLARFRYDEMRGGGGLNTMTDMVLLNLEPFALALRANLHHSVTVFETKGKASFPDLNDDGHRDLLIETRELEDEQLVARSEARWLWDPATDTYLAQ